MRETIEVLRQGDYESGLFDFGDQFEPGSLNLVIASLLAVRDRIPSECRDSATCEISAQRRYSDPYVEIVVSYTKP